MESKRKYLKYGTNSRNIESKRRFVKPYRRASKCNRRVIKK
nr:MAG TPA: hypothetical protein [Bacteriophage sp.]